MKTEKTSNKLIYYLRKATLLLLVVLTLSICTVVVYRDFNSDKKGLISTTVTHTDTIPGDTVPYYIPVDKPYPVYRDTGSVRTQVVDTFAIIRNYLTKNIYKRVLKDDSSAYIAITDTTFKNELQSGLLEFQNRKPTAIITNTTTTLAEKPTWHAYLGMSTTINTKVGFAPAIGIQDKSGRIYNYNYDVVLKNHQVGILFKLK